MNLRATLTKLGRANMAAMQRVPPSIPVLMRDMLNDAAQQVFSVSQRFVPVDTGYLKASGTLRSATRRTLEAEVAYTAEYAAAVHELHQSKGHYLSRAVDLVMDNLPKDVANAIMTEFR